jgi:hypothetical protein
MAVRPRIQREFLAWLGESAPLLQQLIILRRRTDRSMCFEFDVGAPLIRGWLDRNEIVIAVGDDDTTWDLILVLNAFRERTEAGIICNQCTDDERHVFASREELWRDHLFEPLRIWVNEKLAPSVAIALFKYDGASEVKLVASSNELTRATKTIALRRNPQRGLAPRVNPRVAD